MAKKRGPDGVPVEAPSVPYKEDDKAADPLLDLGDNKNGRLGGDKPTLPPNRPGEGETPANLFPDDPPTAPPKRGGRYHGGRQSIDEPPTIIGRPRKRRHADAASSDDQPHKPASNAMDDPVAGWLVVIDGPGQGEFLKVGYGQNSIGRSPNERVTLDFGDSQISRNSHAILTYDPRGNEFYIQQGTGTNLAYLNNKPVLSPAGLEPLSHITLGETTLRFVPLCCKDFTWEKLEEEK